MDRISSTYRQISIHASVKEATCSPSFSFFPKFISIHASVKEATIILHWRWKTLLRFQSTPPWRRRQFSDVSSICFIVFQSTPPWRRRRDFISALCGAIKEFQSTPPWRRRQGFDWNLDAVKISIHASVKEATILLWKRWQTIQISIHASVKEATRFSFLLHQPIEISIHASVKEATSFSWNWLRFKTISIHASVKEATVLVLQPYILHSDFNPRLREGGDYLS